VSQSDILTRSEVIKNLSLPASATVCEAALARNTFCRKRLTEDFWHGVPASNLPVNNDTDPSCFDIPVFTCSAVEYQSHIGLHATAENPSAIFPDAEGTEMPALQRFLKSALRSVARAPAKSGSMLLHHVEGRKAGITTTDTPAPPAAAAAAPAANPNSKMQNSFNIKTAPTSLVGPAHNTSPAAAPMAAAAVPTPNSQGANLSFEAPSTIDRAPQVQLAAIMNAGRVPPTNPLGVGSAEAQFVWHEHNVLNESHGVTAKRKASDRQGHSEAPAAKRIGDIVDLVSSSDDEAT